ncbi:hypothetical protein [Streptomyces griseus]|uniref:hypothetical protein n=1 Tax=Streptomyces griseus TaxID=1911 RepID=UPI00055D6324|nr:hypothetical protein [Streptomyces griseus]
MQRKAASRAGSGGMDVEAALDELYTTAPADFVSRREVLAAAARTAGRAEDARRIHAARRPTLAAWAANRLLRSRPEESRQFLELGQALREAYRSLDAAELKELSAQRGRVVAALSRQAVEVARENGQRLSDAVRQEVDSTLRAVLADAEAADRWATGRLESALTPPSAFPSGSARPSSAAPSVPPEKPTAPRARQQDELAERRRRRQAQLAEARKASAAAERRLRDRRTRQTEAEAALQRAGDQEEQAQRDVSAAEERLRQARENLRHSAGEHRQAEDDHRAAADALTRAEREAREAAKEVNRLRTP